MIPFGTHPKNYFFIQIKSAQDVYYSITIIIYFFRWLQGCNNVLMHPQVKWLNNKLNNINGPPNVLSCNRCLGLQTLLTSLRLSSFTFKTFWILLWKELGGDVTKAEFWMIKNITEKGHIVCYTYKT